MSAWILKHRIVLLTSVAVLFTVAVGSVTGRASWQHIVDVAREYGEPSAAWLPVAVDGMMLSSTALAWVDQLMGKRPRGWSVFGMWLGSIMTLAFNLVSAWSRGPVAMGIAALYAVATLVTVEALFHPSQRYLADRRGKGVEAPVAAPVVAVEPVTAPVAPVPTPVAVEAAEEPVEPPAESVAPKRRARPRRAAVKPLDHQAPPVIDEAQVQGTDMAVVG
jgi:hypothetical protein